ncbi:MAG: glycosyltransferase family 4 protein [Solirubrobacterales bacterium]
MIISFIIPASNMSGGIRVVAIYAQRLQRRGHTVVVVSPPLRRPSLRSRVRAILRGQGWPVNPRKRPSHFDGVDVELRVLDRWRPVTDADVPDADVVVATWWETAEWAAALAPRKGAKAYFVQGHEVFPNLPIDRVEATWRLPLHKIAVAQWLVDLARDRYGDEHASLVPNSVDLGQFHAPSRGKQRVPTVGMIYSTVPCKGCEISLRAYASCVERLPALRLLAFGASPIAPELPLPPGAEYTCLPPQASIKDLYARCDAWLFGSRSEGFGLPILEAMACRTPVIGTPAGAAPELLAGGGGQLVKAEDPEDMARAIETICTLPENAWMEMSRAAFKTAGSYTWDDATDRFERALRTTIDRARRGEIAGGGAESRPAVSSKSMPGLR